MVIATEKIDTQKLSALYDRIYDIADRLIKKHNPCNIHTKTLPAKNLFFNPIFPEQLITRTFCNYELNSDNALCCHGCKYWDSGCTVRALGCKLFLCQCVKSKILQKRFRKLRDYASKYLGFTYYYNNDKEYYSPIRCYKTKEHWLNALKRRIES